MFDINLLFNFDLEAIKFFLVTVLINAKDIFLAPLSDFDVFWTLLPVYVSWIQAEFFVEREKTSYANAFTNGFAMIWASANWLKYLIDTPSQANDFKLFVSVLFIIYGISVWINAYLGKKIAVLIGKQVLISFFIIVFSPYIFGIVDLNLSNFTSMLLVFFFILFIFSILKRVLPEPKGIVEDGN